MKVIIELTAEDFKQHSATILQLVNGSANGSPTTKKKAAKAEEVEEEDLSDFEEEAETEEDESEEVDAEMIKAEIQKAVKAGKKSAVESLLKTFRTKTVSGLKEGQYGSCYAQLKKINAKK